MIGDFTYEIYDELIASALNSGYEFITVRDYVSAKKTPDKFIVLRHDIDRKPKNALGLGKIESAHDVSASYYFRAIEKTFKPDIFREVEELGHEVGYHYEDLDKTQGDVSAAHDRFSSILSRFRQHVNIDTISMHGNPLTPFDNRDMWNDYNLSEYDLLGEVYLSIDFTELIYFTDTNRTWYDEKTMVNDWPIGDSGKQIQLNTTRDLIALIENGEFDRLYILTHPNRWADSYPELLGEFTKDWVINAGKWGLWMIRQMNGNNTTRKDHFHD